MHDFRGSPASAKSLGHLIARLGDGIVGVELGVFEAINFCFLLQTCKNIKILHGVDAYKPYQDFLNGGLVVDEVKSDLIRRFAHHNIKFSGESHRAQLHIMDTLEAVGLFEDESLDFIFQDAYLNYEQAVRELKAWYPKLKKGGIYSGHDFSDPKITRAVIEFRSHEIIKAPMTVCDDAWMWFKD